MSKGSHLQQMMRRQMTWFPCTEGFGLKVWQHSSSYSVALLLLGHS